MTICTKTQLWWLLHWVPNFRGILWSVCSYHRWWSGGGGMMGEALEPWFLTVWRLEIWTAKKDLGHLGYLSLWCTCKCLEQIFCASFARTSREGFVGELSCKRTFFNAISSRNKFSDVEWTDLSKAFPLSFSIEASLFERGSFWSFESLIFDC